MGRRKHIKYEIVKTLPNVVITEIFDNKIIDLENVWNKNTYEGRDIVLELGCGDGEYSLSLAQKYPEKTFIGVDMKSNRLCVGALKALEHKLCNIIFLRTLIERLDLFFNRHSVSEIWITFPDPYPVNKNKNKRLTSKRFIELYQHILKPGGAIHLMTDDVGLYTYSLAEIGGSNARILSYTDDLYQSCIVNAEVLEVRSRYERKFLPVAKTIKYISFRF